MSQEEAIEILKLGDNIFLTGFAGSGKTHVLNQYISYLQSQKISVGITASTGIAATHINGITLHSWAGIGVKKFLSERELQDLLQRPYLRERIGRTKVLVIDEVSMLSAETFDLVDVVCRAFKKTDLPFGGIQIVYVGIFFSFRQFQQGTKNHILSTDRVYGGLWNLRFVI